MATSNRERIDQGLQLIGQGLKPFVESVMAPAASGTRLGGGARRAE